MSTRALPHLLLIAILAMAAGACMGAQPTLKAVTLDKPPTIDGDLSDECWQSVQPVTEFVYLDSGIPPQEQTTARIAHDAKYIYVAFDCKDSQPDKITAQQVKRGGNLHSDDNVTVYLDMFSEFRNDSGCYFRVNAAGTQTHQVQSSETGKTEWVGDWDAAAKRNPGGYTVEMRIPFSILKYDEKNPRISVAFDRWHPRLQQDWVAPNLGKTVDLTRFYLWEGVQPPSMHPKPVTLLYALAGAGSGDSSVRAGADVKYALTPSLTGLLTVNPYFRDVEQEVDSVDFTYNERALGDNRLFFREGKQYFPGSGIYYTRRIRDFDAGAKLVGMVGDYQAGFMNANNFGHESNSVLELTRQFGAQKDFSIWTGGVLSQVEGADYLSTWSSADYKWRHGPTSSTDFHYTYMNTDNDGTAGHGDYSRWTIGTNNGPRKLAVLLERQDRDSDFIPYLGVSSDHNFESWGTKLEWWDSPQKGKVSFRGWGLWLQDADQVLNGEPYWNTVEPSFNLNWRNGQYLFLRHNNYHRLQFHDNYGTVEYGWGSNDLYRAGGISLNVGRRVGGSYRYYQLNQGLRLSDHLSAQVYTEYSQISAPSPYAGTNRQTILGVTYDISPEKGLLGRVIWREGKANLYMAYRQRVRAGMDAYLVYGDPNSDETKNAILLKLIRPI